MDRSLGSSEHCGVVGAAAGSPDLAQTLPGVCAAVPRDSLPCVSLGGDGQWRKGGEVSHFVTLSAQGVGRLTRGERGLGAWNSLGGPL